MVMFCGTIIMDSTTKNSTFLPGNRSRANAKAAIEAVTSCNTVMQTEVIAVLM